MDVTNFDTFCVSPNYVITNSWKDSRHITDDSSCYLYSCHKNLVSQREFRTQRFSCTTPRNGNPMVLGHVSEKARHLGLHVHSICCQSCHSSGDTTISCVTSTSSSWSHLSYSGNLSKVRRDVIRRYTKCIEVGGGHIEHLL